MIIYVFIILKSLYLAKIVQWIYLIRLIVKNYLILLYEVFLNQTRLVVDFDKPESCGVVAHKILVTSPESGCQFRFSQSLKHAV